MKNNKTFFGQSGVGLVGVIVAAAMVVVVALTVANLVTDQTRQSVKLELSGSCQNIANSVVEFIKKDEGSLFISSYGPAPGTTRYAAGLDTTDDDLDRFVFGGVQTPLFMGPTGFQFNLPNGQQTLPNNWRYFNHLNIKNSTNRLLALAASGDFCCDDLSAQNCGARFLDDSLTRSGLRLSEKNIEVDLGISFKDASNNSMCAGRRLSAANLPDSRHNRPAEFKVTVRMLGTGDGKICTASGSVTQNSDTTSSLTLMEMQNQPVLCPASKNGLPSHCNSATPVVFKVKTVKNSTGTSCISNCLSQINSRTCNNLEALNLFNTFSNTSCVNNCLESEPGSSFLCKVGEKNWFTANPNRWEPCETARVYDHDGSIAGRVQIEYLPIFNNARSELTTNATITLSSLTEGRAYVVDVRAVDSRGNIGPSFCASNPSSCSSASDPHFVVIPSAPTVGALVETTRRVAPTALTTQLGRDNTITSQGKYAGALSPLGTNQFQCESGAPRFSVPVTYAVPPGAYGGFVTDSCTATLRLPNGTIQNPVCTCTGGNCFTQLPASAQNGAYEFDMEIVNDCGGAGTARSQDWCKDGNTTIGITNFGNQTFGTTPDFDTHVNYPTTATKACGIVSLCPNVSGGFTPTIGACPNASIGWNPMIHSGCLQAPGNNYCMLALDPCGRSQATNPVAYSTRLIGVPTSSGNPVNSCYQYGGSQVGGNSCATGSYCNANGKCKTDCTTPPCPTNSFTLGGNNCGPRYCPTLNSCDITIGTASSGTACVPQSGSYTWSVTPWGPCTGMGPPKPTPSSCNMLNVCEEEWGHGTSARTVTCVDSGGAIVADSFCTTTKPPTAQACTGYNGGCMHRCDLFRSGFHWCGGGCCGTPVDYVCM